MQNETPSRAGAPEMFNRIAKRYDLINRVLSVGLDTRWRRRVAHLADIQPGECVLDVATGTADLVMELAKSQADARFIGMDPSSGMLELGRQKIISAGVSDRIELIAGAVEHMPFADAAFDVVTIGFGIRNAVDVDAALAEMHRVLKPNGRLLILEFSLPQNAVIRFGHLLYLRHVLPVIGGFLSGNPDAYRYLNKTIETFPHSESFMRLLKIAGFSDARQTKLLLGAVSINFSRKM